MMMVVGKIHSKASVLDGDEDESGSSHKKVVVATRDLHPRNVDLDCQSIDWQLRVWHSWESASLLRMVH
jgi:hypothetical protein